MLQVLFEDAELLLVNKPSGLRVAPIHRWDGNSLLGRAIAHLGTVPHVLHRLDMDTTGVTAFAKTKMAAAHVASQFREQQCSKQYLALCVAGEGSAVDTGKLYIDSPLQTVRDGGISLQRVSNSGKPAATAVEVLDRRPGYALVQAIPETGRLHQIRVCCAQTAW